MRVAAPFGASYHRKTALSEQHHLLRASNVDRQHPMLLAVRDQQCENARSRVGVGLWAKLKSPANKSTNKQVTPKTLRVDIYIDWSDCGAATHTRCSHSNLQSFTLCVCGPVWNIVLERFVRSCGFLLNLGTFVLAARYCFGRCRVCLNIH
jgi:hypothetical protein